MNRKIGMVQVLLLVALSCSYSQVYKSNEPLAHTFSVVAIDQAAGEMAVAVQSHWFSVGSIVSWARSGVGVVATQSFVNPELGPDGLKLMQSGTHAGEALKQLLEADEGRELRQVAFLDASGRVAAFTGSNCIKDAGHHEGQGYSVQANMMLNDRVVPAMAEAFEANGDMPLAERMVAVLEAAQEAGGDIRGKQSAVLIVVSTTPASHPSRDRLVDLRVDDSTDPIKEIGRLLKVHRAYEHMNRGDLAVEEENMELALEEYGAAETIFPGNLEMKYWKAIALANKGRIEEALPVLKDIFIKDDNWKELTRRLPDAGLLTISDNDLKRILNL